MPPDDPAHGAGLYIHFPFCIRRCRYCDFFSTTDTDRIPAYVDALLRELARYADIPWRFESIYLGGGTPSLLDPRSAGRILEAVRRDFRLADDPEITLEANPGTVTPESLAGYRSAGINRLNIGIQSFHDRHLAALGRIHTAREGRACLEAAGRSGFDNIGIDLIYGIPGGIPGSPHGNSGSPETLDQTTAEWVTDLRTALAHGPAHLSCYMLTYEPGTPLFEAVREERVRPLRDDRMAELFRTTIAFLEANGWLHYEVSNFARTPARISRHNPKYWTFTPYLGIGAGAHTYDPPIRRWNHADLPAYLQDLGRGHLPVAGEETLSMEQRAMEAILLGLRMREGISIPDFNARYGRDFRSLFGDLIRYLETEGRIILTPDRCALTRKGMLHLDSIAALFCDLL